MTRLQRLHTNTEEAENSINTMMTHFERRKYPRKLLSDCKDKVLNRTQTQEKDKVDNIIFVTQYYPKLGRIKDIWHKHLPILNQHPDTSFLTEKKFMVAYRRPRNIKDLLVKTDMKITRKELGCQPCGKPRCLTCRFMKKTKTFQSTITNQSYNINGSFNCQSNYVIYLLTCSKCNIQYVGQTSTSINSRMIAHRFDIKHKLDKPVSKHFTTSHEICDLTLTVIDHAPYSVTSRILRETSWIRQLVTMDPYGLNITQTTA
jgi:tripartite motif-containing protein 2/3